MRLPVRHISGNLLWTTNAAVWGVWKVDSENYTHASRATKRERLDALESLFKSMTGEVLLLSLCPQVDAASVVKRMMSGIDEDRSSRYLDMSLNVLEELQKWPLTGRVDFLALPLPNLDLKQTTRAVASSAQAELMTLLGLPVPPVSVGEEEQRLAQARRMASSWPTGIRLRPATEAEILWIYGHSARRGISEPMLPEEGTPRALRGRGHTVTAHTQVVLDEGGRSDRTSKAPTNPFRRRYLKASTEHGDSYQALCILSEMPEAFVFPGSEYLASLDEFGFPIDWAVRLMVEPGSKAEPRSRRQQRELAHQRGEYDGETAGVPASLDKASFSLDEYRDRLTSSATEVEIRASIIVCVWGEHPDEANENAASLANHFGGNDYTLVRPVGDQIALFEAMLPGVKTPRPVLDYTQFLLARDFAMALPFSGCSLGDDTGYLYGIQLSGGGARPVLIDFSHGPRVNASASAAYVGELGSGKSVGMKSAMYSILSTGHREGTAKSRGRALVIDRTPQQEWSRFAEACPGSTQVIRFDEHARISLDPLRVFRGRRAARYCESFLTPLLGISPMSLEGVTLAEGIEATRIGPNPSMAALIENLALRARTPDPEEANDAAVRASASELVRTLRALAKKDLGRTIFDPSLPVVRITDADSIVFAVDRIGLPTKEELSEHRLPSLEIEKKIGWRLMYLITALCREIAFSNPQEFCGVFLDECWWLTSSAEGSNLLLELIADGRKHLAAAFAGSHDPYDIGPKSEIGDKIRALLSHIFVFRHRSKTLAARCLDFLDLDPTDPQMIKMITENLSPINLNDEERALRAGECLYRDLRKRIGGMKVLIPADEEAERAIHTTPGQEAEELAEEHPEVFPDEYRAQEQVLEGSWA